MDCCRQAELRGGGGVHPGAVRGEEQKHDEGGLLPSDVRYRHQQHPVCVRRRHRRHHRQQPARLRSILAADSRRALQTLHPGDAGTPALIGNRQGRIN